MLGINGQRQCIIMWFFCFNVISICCVVNLHFCIHNYGDKDPHLQYAVQIWVTSLINE